MTLAEIRRAWVERREEWSRFGVQVDGSRLCDEFIDDLDRIASEGAEELLTLTEAGRVTGLHPDSIGRAIRDGRLPNYGRPNAPRVRRLDVTKLGRRRKKSDPVLTAPPLVGIRAVQIARAVVTSSTGGRDG